MDMWRTPLVNKDGKATKNRGKVLTFVPTGEYYFTKGMKAFHKRELSKAKKYLERAMNLEPLEPMIYCQLAIVLTEEGNYHRSNQLLLDIVNELDPHMVECYYLLANNYAFLGLFEEAFYYAKEYLRLAPNGEFFEDAQDLIELMEIDEEDISFDGEEDELILMQDKAKAMLESGEFLKAVKILEEMITDYEDFWPAHNNLALAYFYLGRSEDAAKVIEDVLTKNPGNLHAFCNMLVFLHYQKKDTEYLSSVLEKVHPISYEHRYKLGATFAVIGKYEFAFKWLKSLAKVGFEGDHSFYYWLSLSAYHLGYKRYAEQVWNKLLEINPEKKGLEPWKMEEDDEGIEHDEGFIFEKIRSKELSERLYGLFLLSLHKELHDDVNKFAKTDIEQSLLKVINGNLTDQHSIAYQIYHIALTLYLRYKPISFTESGLFHLCFIVIKNIQGTYSTSNYKAWACSIEYVWKKYRNEKVTQKELARQYNISSSTLGKYVKIIHEILS